MTWIQKPFPVIPGYESAGNSVEAKRWLDFKLSQLLDTEDPVWEYRGVLKSRKTICDFVISKFDYPMARGSPTDVHKNNWFSGLCCHQITLDYWQSASETLRTYHLNHDKGVGDCEDVSVLFTTLCLMKKWPARECLGLVLQDGQVLGGHGWSLFQDENGIWRLYEATLSVPPEYPDGYPKIEFDATEWEVGGITYSPFARFNRKEYYETSEEDLMEKRLQLSFKAKETRKKYEAISKAWGNKVKPLIKLNFLSKLRWRQ